MLRIHAVFDRQLGYVQGMSYHAAVLALVASCGGFEALPDNTPAVGDVVGGEALCRMFTSLLAPRQNGPLRQLLSFDMGLWDAHCRVFDRLLFLDQPDLQQTLRRRHVTVNLFMYPWFQVRGWRVRQSPGVFLNVKRCDLCRLCLHACFPFPVSSLCGTASCCMVRATRVQGGPAAPVCSSLPVTCHGRRHLVLVPRRARAASAAEAGADAGGGG